jgi:hypothetical protein
VFSDIFFLVSSDLGLPLRALDTANFWLSYEG